MDELSEDEQSYFNRIFNLDRHKTASKVLTEAKND
jgi:phosphoribosyl-ATP pyrophosphohydrolase